MVKLRHLVTAGAVASIVLLILAVVAPSAAEAPKVQPAAGSLAGQLLVATPKMPDPRFAQTVIYMVRHDATGAMGLIVNRPIRDVPLAHLLERLGMESDGVSGSIRVHYGGPVAGKRGFMLHSADYVGKGTTIVHGGVALTDQPDILTAIAAGTGPHHSLFAVGYAGWSPGQLEAEMGAGHWVTAPADEALLFEGDYRGKWQRAMDRRIIRL
ncbi:MAG: YqgE/AlgH family protein [Candidatus Methylomirabilia bacterium]